MANLSIDDSSVERPEALQYIRKCQLIVYQNASLQGLDLSELRIKFSVKLSDVQTPNVADIRVYNIAPDTALSLLMNLSPDYNAQNPIRGRVILSAGYDANYGVIFEGNIKQILLGRESATDTYVDFVCGDGDRAYNFAVLNQTLQEGATQTDQVTAAVTKMTEKGVTLGHLGEMPNSALPRGKVMYGNARNYLRNVAQNTQKTWSIQQSKITFVPVRSYLPNERVVLTSKTGLVGTPQQTDMGVNIKCLLNPLLKIGGLVDIAEATVTELKVNLNQLTSPINFPAPLSADGSYYNLVLEHTGDTRGVEWYTNILGITHIPSSNPLNSVQVSGG